MNSFRKWLYKPKKTDSSLLAQFYFADEDLNQVAAELDSFDGRKDPERCTMLVNQLRVCQDRVLNVIQKIMDDAIPSERANRDFRVKFPDDVLQESLAGQLWFGAECLAAGSSILNREVESASMRPLARALTKNLDSLRSVLREQCLRTLTEYTDRIQEALVIFDKLFAEFELSYVSAMVPVKTMKEYDMLQEVTVLFSETVQRALKLELVSQDMIDDYDPALMFTIPRLAIVCGLLIYPEGPLNPDMEPTNISEMYRPFQTLLFKIRELLYTLSHNELVLLEKSLCSSEEPDMTTRALGLSKEEGFMQVDQGFHESGEGIVPVGDLGSSLLIGSGGLRTPVNTDPGLLDLDTVSPSSTIEEGSFSFSQPVLERASSEEVITNLNKSESQDSGLHSENVSTSDTVTVDCLPCISQEVEGATETMPSGGSLQTEGEATLSVSPERENTEPEVVADENSCDSSSVNGAVMATSGSNLNLADISERNANEPESNQNTVCDLDDCEDGYDAHQLCCSILAEIVEDVVHQSQGASQRDAANCCDKPSDCDTHCDSRDTAGSGEGVVTEGHAAEPLGRQFSWQYNVQFALPHISLSEQEMDQERASSGSISSNSTISDNNQPCDSVTEFVIETLAAMGSDTMLASAAASHCDNTQVSDRPHSSDSKNQVSSDKTVPKPVANHQRQSASKCHTSRNTNQPRSAQRSRSNVPSDMVEYLDCSVAHGSNSEPPSRSSDMQHVQRGRGKQENYENLEHIHCKTGSQSKTGEHKADGKTVQTVKNPDSCSSSSSSCHSNTSCCTSSCSCDKDCCCTGSETSSCNSEVNDDEEIALAIQAAEMASRSEARSRFRSSSDLIHRLFVCIAGVADQLQTNYASDLRHILKCVFELNSTNVPELDFDVEVAEPAEVMNSQPDVASSGDPEERVPSTGSSTSGTTRPAHQARQAHTSPRLILDEPPMWVPDDEVERCTACKSGFTFVRRRHHCRNCGKIFCGKCSSTTVPLPQYGHQKPVRVCHRCFLFQVSHFTITE